jgi:maltose O-acetyltransferase
LASTLIEGLLAASRLRSCSRVGRGARTLGTPTIYGVGRIEVGDRLTLSSRPVPSHLAAGEGALLEIGDDVAIAYGAAIAAFLRVRIGRGTRIGPFALIMDTNFHGAAGDLSVQHDCRPVEIGEGCRIGSRVTITRGAAIGDGAEILAGSVVSSPIPAGACAGGVRASVLGSAGDPLARWDGIAGQLPDLLREALGLGGAPPLQAEHGDLAGWPLDARARLADAVEARFGFRLSDEVLRATNCIADLAAAIDRGGGRAR